MLTTSPLPGTSTRSVAEECLSKSWNTEEVGSGSWSCEKAQAEALTASRLRWGGRVWSAGGVWRLLGLEALLVRFSGRLGRLGDRMRAYVCDDYVLIAARSGWTPIMLMTRVRL